MTTEKETNAELILDEMFKALKDRVDTYLSTVAKDISEDVSDELSEMFGGSIGEPTEQQLANIIRLTGAESTADQWLVVPVEMSNNFVDLGYRTWDLPVLQMMAQGFTGRPHILDHEWYDSDKMVSFILDVKLVHDTEVDDFHINGAGFSEFNKQILEDGGFVWVYGEIAIAKDHDTAQAILSRRYNDVSTGSVLTNPVLYCSNCSREHGRRVSYLEKVRDTKGDESYLCPHYVPSRSMLAYFGDDPEIQFADYSIMGADYHEPIELSSCMRGALPAAGVIREAR